MSTEKMFAQNREYTPDDDDTRLCRGKFPMTKHGLACDPRGAQVSMQWQGRELLGDVIGCRRDPVTGSTLLQVRHFNGEMWPIEPVALAVDVLVRKYENPNLDGW